MKELKRDSSKGVFLLTLRNFEVCLFIEHLLKTVVSKNIQIKWQIFKLQKWGLNEKKIYMNLETLNLKCML